MQSINFFAVDLGATSGRTILGSIVGGKLEQRELTRFSNPIIQTGGHFFWDIYALYNEIIRGLKVVAEEQIEIASIGIDTWGVDFVCIGKDGGVLRNPYCYRDPHTDHAMEEYFKLIPKEKVMRKRASSLCSSTPSSNSVRCARIRILHWRLPTRFCLCLML